ncbi:MAG: hypothetical protein V3T86_10720 [Planctomycetota bacterium]
MNDAPRRSVLPLIAGAYAVALSAAILAGLPGALSEDATHFSNALRMPVAAGVIAFACAAGGFGLLRWKNWARFVFLIAAPWGAVAVGSVFAETLWRKDIPYTALLVFVYAPLVFAISRFRVLPTFGVNGHGWAARGGWVALACTVVMIGARLVVSAQAPAGGLDLTTLEAWNEHTKHLALCDVPLLHYGAALVAVSLPTGPPPEARPRKRGRVEIPKNSR